MDGLILIGIGLILLFLTKSKKGHNNDDLDSEAYNRGFADGYKKALEDTSHD